MHMPRPCQSGPSNFVSKSPNCCVPQVCSFIILSIIDSTFAGDLALTVELEAGDLGLKIRADIRFQTGVAKVQEVPDNRSIHIQQRNNGKSDSF